MKQLTKTIDWVSVLMGLLISIIVLSYGVSRIPVLEIETKITKPIVVVEGVPFRLCRKVEYMHDAVVDMSKAVVRNKGNGAYVTINFPKVSFKRNKGVQTICRDMLLPNGLEMGEWELHTYLTTHHFPFWTRDFEAPVVPLWLTRNPEEIK